MLTVIFAAFISGAIFFYCMINPPQCYSWYNQYEIEKYKKALKAYPYWKYCSGWLFVILILYLSTLLC